MSGKRTNSAIPSPVFPVPGLKPRDLGVGEILEPMDLIQRYQEKRASLNAEIDRVLAEITQKLNV